MTRFSSAIAVLVVVASVGAAGCGDDDDEPAAPASTEAAADETATKTITVAFDGAVDDSNDRVFAVTYFYSPELGPAELGETLTAVFGEGHEPPESVVFGIAGVCGPDGYAAAIAEATGFTVAPVTDTPCTDDDEPFSVDLEVPTGTTLHYSMESGLVSDLENIETFAGNYVGDPNDPPTAEDFEVVDADDSASYTYRFGASG
jgi:hypothetical protein